MAHTKILVIRRENIGDLICTTPLIRALRNQLPDANIQALVSRYNVPVLYGNKDLNEVHSYQKAKHRQDGEGGLQIYWDRLKTVLYLRKQQFDWILLPGGPHLSAIRFAKMIAPKKVLIRGASGIPESGHEVERTCRLLGEMGLAYETPKLHMEVAPARSEQHLKQFSMALGFVPTKIYGIHLSARKVSQQWPVENFIEFVNALPLAEGEAVAVYWAPGASNDPRHPGDDDKAAQLLEGVVGRPVVPVRTETLEDLIAGVSICSVLFCADGGAMHVAAALDKPVVCMFGRSDPVQWGPWGVPCRILSGEGQDVRAITVRMALDAIASMEG